MAHISAAHIKRIESLYNTIFVCEAAMSRALDEIEGKKHVPAESMAHYEHFKQRRAETAQALRDEFGFCLSSIPVPTNATV